MKSNSPAQCLENTIASMFEAICNLGISHARTCRKLIEVSDLPEEERKAILDDLEHMEMGSMAALIEIRKAAETASAEKSVGNWFQRIFQRNSV